MEQTKTNTPPRQPQWVEDMEKWQKEDVERRSVLCIASDQNTDGLTMTLLGYSFPLIMAFLAESVAEEDFFEIVKDVYLAKTNPFCLEDLLNHWVEFKKEHGYPLSKEEAESKSSIKSSLKNLFQTLADKL